MPRAILWIITVYAAAMNVAAFAVFGMDKRRARKNAWRVPEKTLFLLALAGGSLGAVCGMCAFRHKTRHWYFRYGLPAILLAHCALLAWIL
ncbi:MAG: DUF1294 domain-containing protein [Ruminococcaceae bacterium]|nr:DUF1294 domain-containing protein [Oscillospiraceae bacterium]